VKNTKASPKRFWKILLNALSLAEKEKSSYNTLLFIDNGAKEG